MTAPYPVPPPPGYGYGYGPPVGPPVRRAANPAGIAITLIGGVLALVGCFVDWYDSAGNFGLKQIVDIADALDETFPEVYLGWGMFAVLAAAVVAGLFANLPGGLSGALRVISPILAAVGALGVFLALNDLQRQGSVFDNSALGLYLTLIGFVVAGVGGAIGARRVR